VTLQPGPQLDGWRQMIMQIRTSTSAGKRRLVCQQDKFRRV
jgi:hypothetical protein